MSRKVTIADVDKALAYVRYLVEKLDLKLQELTPRCLNGVVSPSKREQVLSTVKFILSPEVD